MPSTTEKDIVNNIVAKYNELKKGLTASEPITFVEKMKAISTLGDSGEITRLKKLQKKSDVSKDELLHALLLNERQPSLSIVNTKLSDSKKDGYTPYTNLAITDSFDALQSLYQPDHVVNENELQQSDMEVEQEQTQPEENCVQGEVLTAVGGSDVVERFSLAQQQPKINEIFYRVFNTQPGDQSSLLELYNRTGLVVKVNPGNTELLFAPVVIAVKQINAHRIEPTSETQIEELMDDDALATTCNTLIARSSNVATPSNTLIGHTSKAASALLFTCAAVTGQVGLAAAILGSSVVMDIVAKCSNFSIWSRNSASTDDAVEFALVKS